MSKIYSHYIVFYTLIKKKTSSGFCTLCKLQCSIRLEIGKHNFKVSLYDFRCLPSIQRLLLSCLNLNLGPAEEKLPPLTPDREDQRRPHAPPCRRPHPRSSHCHQGHHLLHHRLSQDRGRPQHRERRIYNEEFKLKSISFRIAQGSVYETNLYYS